ncbi:MAG: hypothetical protein ABIG43_05360 [Chloroflexota bacterium]
MDIGLLWFDNDPKSDIEAKVSRAAAYYRKKYGQEPNLCFVHPSMVKEGKLETGWVTLQSSTSMIPYHFWLGVK